MSLTTEDLQAIKGLVVGVVNEAIEELMNPRFDELGNQVTRLEIAQQEMRKRLSGIELSQEVTNQRLAKLEESQRDMSSHLIHLQSIDGKLTALQNDVKELYEMVGRLEHSTITDKKFAKLPTTKKLLTIHAELLSLAQQLDVTLPA